MLRFLRQPYIVPRYAALVVLISLILNIIATLVVFTLTTVCLGVYF